MSQTKFQHPALWTHASMFFPNIRELLTILAVLQMGSTEAERLLHTWLRNAMTSVRLSDLADKVAMHGHTISRESGECWDLHSLGCNDW